MRRDDTEQLLFSASYLVHFLGCTHATQLDLKKLEEPLPKAEDGPGEKLIQENGIEHERAYLAELEKSLLSRRSGCQSAPA